MAAKLTRLTHKIATQLHVVAESCTIYSSYSRRPVRKLLDTPARVLQRSQVSHSYETKGKVMILYILICRVLEQRKMEHSICDQVKPAATDGHIHTKLKTLYSFWFITWPKKIMGTWNLTGDLNVIQLSYLTTLFPLHTLR